MIQITQEERKNLVNKFQKQYDEAANEWVSAKEKSIEDQYLDEIRSLKREAKKFGISLLEESWIEEALRRK